jgi:hypothetical protein
MVSENMIRMLGNRAPRKDDFARRQSMFSVERCLDRFQPFHESPGNELGVIIVHDDMPAVMNSMSSVFSHPLLSVPMRFLRIGMRESPGTPL